MSTSVQGALMRARIGYGSLGHITAAPLIDFDSEGLLFAGDLTDEEIGEVWWHVTSRDDEDRSKREAIAAKVAEAEASGSASDQRYAELARYVARLGTP